MSNDSHSLIGRMVGKYKVTGMLGRGGMAEVYKAYQENLDRYVAIKLMYPFMSADENFVSRFKREARTMARIDHPNIVRVYDFDVADNRYYIVMQYIQGGTLKDAIETALKQGQLVALSKTIQVMLEMADALAYAHSYGMVHRDIKPGNIMLGENGRAILTDFGIAKMTSGTQYTATGAMVGTPAYMSPEQGLGKSGDERSDLYALGVLFYNLVTGRLPHEAETPIALLLKHVNEQPIEPTTLNPQLPFEIEQVVYKLLEKEPEDRYQTANDFARDLRGAARSLQESGVDQMMTVPVSLLEDKPTPAPISTFPASAVDATQVYDITPADGVVLPGSGTQVVEPGPSTQVAAGGQATAVNQTPVTKEEKRGGVPVWMFAVGLIALLGIIGFLVFEDQIMGTGENEEVMLRLTEDAVALAAFQAEADELTRAAEVEGTVESIAATQTLEVLAVELTVTAEQAELLLAEAATASAEPTEAPTIEATETPTLTPTPTETPEPTETACNYGAEEVDVFTYNTPKQTTAPVGAGLSLNWTISNSGDCAWPADLVLQNSGGEDFGQSEGIALETIPEPGDEVTIRVEQLNAPSTVGGYDSTWQLVDGSGTPVGDEISFSLTVYTLATAEPAAEPTVAADTGGGTDEGGAEEPVTETQPVNFNFAFSNCVYPGGGIEYRCNLNIVPYGGPQGTYTIWIFDGDKPSEFQQTGGAITHFIGARRCSPWIHEVKVQNNASGEEISQNLYFDPTQNALFPGGGFCTLE